MAAAFLKSDGDIRTVLRTMIYSPEFWSRQAYRSKVKKPFDIVVSTVRALSFAGQQERVSLGSLVQWTARLGEPLYQCQPPNGYSDKAEAWVNTGGLLNRMNFALQAAGQRRLAQPDLARLLGTGSMQTPEEILSRAVKVFLGGQVSESTEATLQRKLTETQQSDGLIPQSAPAIIAGLVLGSPEFQRR